MSPAPTLSRHAVAGRKGGLVTARTADPHARGRKGQAGLLARFAAVVDKEWPNLNPMDRGRKIDQLRALYFSHLRRTALEQRAAR